MSGIATRGLASAVAPESPARAAYERWAQFDSAVPVHPVLRGIRAAGLDPLMNDGADDTVLVIDHDGIVIDVAASANTKVGLDAASTRWFPLVDIFPGRQRARILSAISDALAGDGVRVAARTAGADGESFDVGVSFIPVRNATGGGHVGAMVIIRNVSVDHSITRERERSGRLLALAGRLAGFAGWSLDLDSDALVLTERGLSTGTRLASMATLTELVAALSEHHSALLRRAIARTVSEGRSFDVAVALPGTDDGDVMHLRLVGEPVVDDSGRVVSINGAVHDITQTVTDRQQRLEVEELLTSTLNSISDGLAIVDRDWTLTYANPRLESIVGVSADDALGSSLWGIVEGLTESEFASGFRRAMVEQTTVRVRERVERLDCWLEATAYPSGAGLAVHVRDVTEFELAASKAREAEDRTIMLTRLLDISHDAIIVRSLDDRVRYWNRGAADLYGWEAEEALGRVFGELVGVDAHPFDIARTNVVRDGRWSGTLTTVTRDGRTVVTDSRWQVVATTGGEPDAIFSVCADVTEHRRRDDALRRARQLESIGTVAGGIAHDLNNVLTPILMATQLLASGPTTARQSDTLSMIETAAMRGADMVRQVLAYSRGTDGRREELSIPALLSELTNYCREALPESIRVSVVDTAGHCHVRGDSTQLMQVMMNLVSNARDAMPAGGTLRISTRMLAEKPSIEAGEAAGPWVSVIVEDSGTGMSADVLDKLFEPFFTTKPVGSGTGLGLATSFAIAQSHGGDLIASSDGYSGSRFMLVLPVCDCAWGAAFDAELVVDELPRGEGETVLIVDDEEQIVVATRMLLEHYGYRVDSRSNGREALEAIMAGAVVPDVIISDVSMPDMGGLELAAALRDSGLTTPMILSSGRTSRGDIPIEASDNIELFLDKPFTTHAVLSSLRTALNRGRKS